jgi:hypothetical protein
MKGANGGTGVGLVEVYDGDQGSSSIIANISSRGFVDKDDQVMIGGVIVGDGTGKGAVVVRAIGPSLAASNVANPLEDPVLELRGANGTSVATNDNWQETQAGELSASGIAPSDPREAAILARLQPGNYTAVVRGKDNGVGVGLVEVYNLH